MSPPAGASAGRGALVVLAPSAELGIAAWVLFGLGLAAVAPTVLGASTALTLIVLSPSSPHSPSPLSRTAPNPGARDQARPPSRKSSSRAPWAAEPRLAHRPAGNRVCACLLPVEERVYDLLTA
jgi:hypothetical protein